MFSQDDNPLKHNGPLVLSKSLLNFDITGLKKRYSALVCCWQLAKLSGRQLFFLSIHVMKKLEELRFKADRIVGDNANVNVKLFKLQEEQLIGNTSK